MAATTRKPGIASDDPASVTVSAPSSRAPRIDGERHNLLASLDPDRELQSVANAKSETAKFSGLPTTSPGHYSKV